MFLSKSWMDFFVWDCLIFKENHKILVNAFIADGNLAETQQILGKRAYNLRRIELWQIFYVHSAHLKTLQFYSLLKDKTQ